MQAMIVFFGQEMDRFLQPMSWWLADQAFVLPQKRPRAYRLILLLIW